MASPASNIEPGRARSEGYNSLNVPTPCEQSQTSVTGTLFMEMKMSQWTKKTYIERHTPQYQMERLERRLKKCETGETYFEDKFQIPVISCPGRYRHIIRQIERVSGIIQHN